jgi:dephospho-CoA kinase
MPASPHPPEVWVITGGIATGKSTAGAFLRARLPEAAWFDADRSVAGLLATAEIAAKLCEVFGTRIINRLHGTVDRAALRDLILADSQARGELEGILHPRVRHEFAQALKGCQSAGVRHLIADVPLFFEAGRSYPAHRVVVVAVSAATQRLRLAARSHWPAAAIEGMLAAQWPILDKVAQADAVWWNEGPLEVLRRQIQRSCESWATPEPHFWRLVNRSPKPNHPRSKTEDR